MKRVKLKTKRMKKDKLPYMFSLDIQTTGKDYVTFDE